MRSSRIKILSVSVLPLLLVAGCGSSGDSSSSGDGSSSSTPSAGDDASGKVSPMTDLTFKTNKPKGPSIALKHKPFKVDKTTAKVIKEGEGAKVTDAETLKVDYLIVNGTTGKPVEGNHGRPEVSMDLSSQQMLPGLAKGLKGQKVGSQVLLAVPPKDAFGSTGNQQAKISPDDTVLFYVEIHKASTPLKAAKGTAVKPKKGLPKVKVLKDKPAKITVPETKAPSKLTVQPLVKGKGPKVKAGQMIKVDYSGVLWKGSKPFDSSMGKQPFSFQVGANPPQVISGWDKAMQGQRVGSRLLVIVPPSEGYGKKANQGIPANSTLVFSVDILAAD